MIVFFKKTAKHQKQSKQQNEEHYFDINEEYSDETNVKFRHCNRSVKVQRRKTIQ